METFLRPFIYVNYIDEYLKLLFQHYGVKDPRYFCTYFKFDYENSVLDDKEHIQGTSYHIVGNLSGKKWKKILFLPLWGSENIGPVTNLAREDGIVREVTVNFILPDYLGVRPISGDFLFVYDNVTQKLEHEQPLYIVSNKQESHLGKRKIYKIECKNSFIKLSEIDNQKHISSSWLYVNYYRKIFKLPLAEKIVQTIDFNYEIFNSFLKRDENINNMIFYEKDVYSFGAYRS